jgi:hypothetical protein
MESAPPTFQAGCASRQPIPPRSFGAGRCAVPSPLRARAQDPLALSPPLPSRIGPVGFAEFGQGYARDLAADPAAAAWAAFDAMAFDGAVTSASKTQARRVFYAVAGQIG